MNLLRKNWLVWMKLKKSCRDTLFSIVSSFLFTIRSLASEKHGRTSVIGWTFGFCLFGQDIRDYLCAKLVARHTVFFYNFSEKTPGIQLTKFCFEGVRNIAQKISITAYAYSLENWNTFPLDQLFVHIRTYNVRLSIAYFPRPMSTIIIPYKQNIHFQARNENKQFLLPFLLRKVH